MKHGWQRSFHESYPVAYPYIHFHVFDEHNTRELFELMFEDVQVDVLKTEEFSDNVAIARNSLKPGFVSEFGRVAREYGVELPEGSRRKWRQARCQRVELQNAAERARGRDGAPEQVDDSTVGCPR